MTLQDCSNYNKQKEGSKNEFKQKSSNNLTHKSFSFKKTVNSYDR